MDIIAKVRNRHFVSNESISSIAHSMGVSRLTRKKTEVGCLASIILAALATIMMAG